VSDGAPKSKEVQAFVEMLASALEQKGRLPDVAELEHELAKQFRLIVGDELEQLAKDIAKNELLHKIVIYQGKILDGRNRYEALKRNGHQFTASDFVLFDGGSGITPECYVISANAMRRHLSKKERDALGAKYFKAMPKEKPGPKPGQTKEIPEADNSPQNLRRIPEETQAKDIPAQKRPYDRRLEEAAAVTGTTPGAIRAELAEKKGPEAAAARAVSQKLPRAPRKSKPKPLIMPLTDGLTLRQVFDTIMLKGGYKMLDGTVKGFGRVVFTADADIKPKKAFYLATESEIIEIAAAEDPPILESDALDMLDYCKSKGLEYKDWAAALRNYRRRGWLWSQKPKPPPQRVSPPTQRAPIGRSTAMTPAQRDRAAADQERRMKESMDGEHEKWSRR
jgi:hypothetical protein